MLIGHHPDEVEARRRAKRTWPAIAVFTIACAVGAVCEAAIWPVVPCAARQPGLAVAVALGGCARRTTRKPGQGVPLEAPPNLR